MNEDVKGGLPIHRQWEGIVRKYFRKRSEMILLTPLSSDKDIRALLLGSILVDPQTFEDRFSR